MTWVTHSKADVEVSPHGINADFPLISGGWVMIFKIMVKRKFGLE